MIETLKRYLIIILTISSCVINTNNLLAQLKDSTLRISSNGDSIYQIRENICKNKFLGNSWYISSSYNLASTNEFDFNFGRTYGFTKSSISHDFYFGALSWGAGLGLTSKHGIETQIAKLFWGFSSATTGIFSGLRFEYIYDITNNSNYLRPSIGLSIVYFDIFYNYSIMLTGNENIFEHGVTFRINYFHRARNWQRTYDKTNKNAL